MNTKAKGTLIRQASKLYTLGLTVEMRREKLRRLVEGGVSYDCAQMRTALKKFQVAEDEWRRLEQKHLDCRLSLGVESESNSLLQNQHRR